MASDESLRNAQRTSRALHKRCAKLIAFLRAHEQWTYSEVIMATGLGRDQVINLLREMWRPGPDRQIRICAWREDSMGRPTIRVFEFGTAPDEPRRPPVPAKLRTQLYLERKEKRAQHAAQAAIDNMIRSGKVTQ